MSETPNLIVDARGLSCPQPVLLLRQAIKPLAPASRVSLLASDPMASVDVRVYCLRAKHHLLAETAVGDHYRFDIERG